MEQEEIHVGMAATMVDRELKPSGENITGVAQRTEENRSALAEVWLVGCLVSEDTLHPSFSARFTNLIYGTIIFFPYREKFCAWVDLVQSKHITKGILSLGKQPRRYVSWLPEKHCRKC